MDPNVWGPHAWIFLHTITLNYPNNPSELDKLEIMNFFHNLPTILPCQTCALHFKENLKKYPISKHFHSKKDLVQWLIDMHNEVNKLNNKKIYSYEEVNNYYLNLYNSGQPDMRFINNQSNYKYIIYILILSLLFYIFYNFYISNNKWGESKN